MKTIYALLATVLTLLPSTICAAETAQARLFCYSLRLAEGSDSYGDTLDFSTIGGPPYNGELLPYSGNTWASGFALEIYAGYTTIYGTIYVNLPLGADANGNGFDDFFEVSQGVGTTTTSGSYSTSISSGTVSARWSRSAGSKTGNCVFNLDDDTFGNLGDYTIQFDILEYTGPLTYTPGTNTVSARINLTQTGNPANTLAGPIIFDKSSADRFNTLTNQPGTWTNAAMQTLTFDNEILSRDLSLLTNYYGYVYFGDGDPNTGGADYQLWVLSIDDTNDVNHNGIPDFSDDPQAVSPPNPPMLGLALGSTSLLLTIHGDAGHVHEVQQITSLSSTNWQTVLSTNLTSDPQVVSLPLPSGSSTFWRVIAQ